MGALGASDQEGVGFLELREQLKQRIRNSRMKESDPAIRSADQTKSRSDNCGSSFGASQNSISQWLIDDSKTLIPELKRLTSRKAKSDHQRNPGSGLKRDPAKNAEVAKDPKQGAKRVGKDPVPKSGHQRNRGVAVTDLSPAKKAEILKADNAEAKRVGTDPTHMSGYQRNSGLGVQRDLNSPKMKPLEECKTSLVIKVKIPPSSKPKVSEFDEKTGLKQNVPRVRKPPLSKPPPLKDKIPQVDANVALYFGGKRKRCTADDDLGTVSSFAVADIGKQGKRSARIVGKEDQEEQERLRKAKKQRLENEKLRHQMPLSSSSPSSSSSKLIRCDSSEVTRALEAAKLVINSNYHHQCDVRANDKEQRDRLREAARLKLLEVEKNAYKVTQYWPEFKSFQVEKDFLILISGH